MRLLPFILGCVLGEGTSPVSVSLDSSWNSSPLYIEAIEFVNTLKNERTLEKFIRIIAGTKDLQWKDDVKLYEIIKNAARKCKLSEGTIKMLLFSLSLRVYSPRVEAGRNEALPFPEKCVDQAFYSISDQRFCTIEEIEASDISGLAGLIQPTDLQLGSAGSKFLVINGIPENDQYEEKLNLGAAFAAENNLGFAVRWKLHADGQKTPLTGYGVELRLKSTEYKAQDDANDDISDGDDIETAAGFNFKVLKTRFPDLQKEIQKFAKYVSDTSQEIQPMKKWQMGDLSLQAAQSAINAHNPDDDSSLAALTEIAGDFPQQANKLARISVSPKLKKEIQANQGTIGTSIGVGKGGSYFSINGMSIDLTSQWGDPFQLLETVRGELETMERLSELDITGDAAQKILKAPVPKGESDPVLKISNKEAVWLNDIENDKQYSQFTRSMNEFLRPTFPGVLRRIRYNYLNMEIYLDQNMKDLDPITGLIDTLFDNNLPVRIGIVFTGDSEKAYKTGGILYYLVAEMKNKKQSPLKAWQKWVEMKSEKFSNDDINKKITEESVYYKSAVASANYFKSLGMKSESTILVNGALVPDLTFDEDGEIEQKVYEFLLEAVPDIQRAVYYGQLDQGTNIVKYLNKRPQVVQRFNQAILNAQADLIDLGRLFYKGNYLGGGKAVTVWAVVDLSTKEGSNLVKNAVNHQIEETQSRLAIIHCGESENYLDALSSIEFDSGAVLFEIKEATTTEHVLCDSLNINTIYVNGQTYKNAELFIPADFALTVSLAIQGGAEQVVKAMPDADGNQIMKVLSALSFLPEIKERKEAAFKAEKFSVLNFPPQSKNDAIFEVVAIFDPASEDAQKMAPIIQTLRKVINMNLKIFLNCQEGLSELPIKSFYRFVLDSEPIFETNGPRALFSNLPQHSLFTMAIVPPESWMVAAVEAEHDLDNIKLIEQGEIYARFELQHLLLEGQAFDTATGSPPRGIQMDLTTGKTVLDTIVMANLGYFQFKAAPGYWNMKLREGLSSDIYKIDSTTQTDGSSEDGQNVKVIISSFTSKSIRVGVSKKPGMENLDVLGTADSESQDREEGSIWSSIGETIGLKSKKEVKETKVINIFSLASGHMYERLMRIMMLSVIRKTDTKVKFWILGNYASPAFRKSLPIISKEYGFEYEFVQYKWPRWLNAQREKQRTMWGYKILFLDVLFPLDVEKIIFVDADQIIRADLKELVDLDLEGNPYGYTPFCEDKKEMDGFRFWLGGYWKQHLAGRKYHISAIYVVDLKRFRQLAAGDRLRGQYQGLSQDPNSLANLDQDLPNNMIHQVGIKSLPQEWLWCATWCSDASKESAKTIDLCNNPLTKEPKLTAAARIVPEWTGFDEEIKILLNGKPNKTNDKKVEEKSDEKDEL